MFQLSEKSNVDAQSRTFGKYTLLRSSTDNFYRSVIVNSETDTVVCLAPPRSIPRDNFTWSNPVIITDIVEGTMINAFYDKEWILCTKSNVGATNKFLPESPTFGELFWEAAHVSGFTWSELNPDYSYSFVLQHPKNRIVAPVEVPAIYLIAVYLIRKNTVLVMHDAIRGCKQPTQHSFISMSDIDEYLTTQPYTCKGLMLQCDNARVKFRTPAYDAVENLRGNHSSVPYRVVELCQETNNAVIEFMRYYPEYSEVVKECWQKRLLFINNLYSLYTQIYKQRVKLLRDTPFVYRPHLYKLHELYISKMRPIPIHKKAVREYVHTLAPAQIMFVFNQGI